MYMYMNMCAKMCVFGGVYIITECVCSSKLSRCGSVYGDMWVIEIGAVHA